MSQHCSLPVGRRTDVWLASQGYVRGAVVAPQVVYDLGLDWYATRLDLDYTPATPEEAEATFAAHGLTGEFWSLKSPAER